MAISISKQKLLSAVILAGACLLVWMVWASQDEVQSSASPSATPEIGMDQSQVGAIEGVDEPQRTEKQLQPLQTTHVETSLENLDRACPSMDQVIHEVDSQCISGLSHHFLDTAVKPQEFSWRSMPELCKGIRQKAGFECIAACEYPFPAFRTPQELVRLAVRNPPTYRDIFQDPMSDREQALEATSNSACQFYSNRNQPVRPELSEQCNAEAMLRYVLFVEACTHHRLRLFSDRALQDHHPEGLSRYAILLSEIDKQTWSFERRQGIRNWMREDIYRNAWVVESCNDYPMAKISLSDLVKSLLQTTSIGGESKSSVNSPMTAAEQERYAAIFKIEPLIDRRDRARWNAEYIWRYLSFLGNPWALSEINIDEAESQLIEYRRKNWPLMDALSELFYYEQNDEGGSDRTVRDRLVVKARQLAQNEGIELDWNEINHFMDLPNRARLDEDFGGIVDLIDSFCFYN